MQPSNALDSTKQKALDQLRKEVEDEKIIQSTDSINFDEWVLLRFLRARNFDVKEAKAMLIKAQGWRKSVEGVGVDALYDEIDPLDYPQREAVFKYWPMWYHKTDKQGRPFLLVEFGNINMTALTKDIGPKLHWKTVIVTVECLVRELMPASAKIKGEPVDGACIVLDLKGFGLGHFWQIKDLFKDGFQMAQDFYPETIGKLIWINTPTSFTMVWGIIKPWLAPVTVSKVEILGNNYADVLLKYVDAENLPSSVGGNCKCEGLGGCSLSSAGPWLEGRVYHGTGESKFKAKSPVVEREVDKEQNELLTQN